MNTLSLRSLRSMELLTPPYNCRRRIDVERLPPSKDK